MRQHNLPLGEEKKVKFTKCIPLAIGYSMPRFSCFNFEGFWFFNLISILFTVKS